MSDLKQAAQQALEFCELLVWHDVAMTEYVEEQRERVEAALRAALEAQEEPRREWQWLTDDEVLRTLKWDEAMVPLIAKGMPTEVLEAAKREAIERHRAIEAALKEKNHE